VDPKSANALADTGATKKGIPAAELADYRPERRTSLTERTHLAQRRLQLPADPRIPVAGFPVLDHRFVRSPDGGRVPLDLAGGRQVLDEKPAAGLDESDDALEGALRIRELRGFFFQNR